MHFFSLVHCSLLQKKKNKLKGKRGKLKKTRSQIQKKIKMEESVMETEDLELSCPEFTEFSEQMLSRVSFWVEGFLSCSIAMAGFLGNVGSAVILSGKGISRNSSEFDV